MLGRAANQTPVILRDVGEGFFGGASGAQSREHAVESRIPYIDAKVINGARLDHVVRHMLGLYQGQYGGRQYRRHLSERAHQAASDTDVLREAIAFCSAPKRDLAGVSAFVSA